MEPSIEKQEREKLIDEAWGGSVHPYTQNFMKLLCDNGTISALPDCFPGVPQPLQPRPQHHRCPRGQRRAHDRGTDEARLREKLEAKCKKHVELTVQTDPTLLGGIRLELPDRQLDGSGTEPPEPDPTAARKQRPVTRLYSTESW